MEGQVVQPAVLPSEVEIQMFNMLELGIMNLAGARSGTRKLFGSGRQYNWIAGGSHIHCSCYDWSFLLH
jgi:hypothetical protein